MPSAACKVKGSGFDIKLKTTTSTESKIMRCIINLLAVVTKFIVIHLAVLELTPSALVSCFSQCTLILLLLHPLLQVTVTTSILLE